MNASSAGLDSPSPESEVSLIDALSMLAFQISEQNQLLGQLIMQNAVLIDSLVEQEEPLDDSHTDMAGNPIKVS